MPRTARPAKNKKIGGAMLKRKAPVRDAAITTINEVITDARLDRQKHFQDSCFSPKTRSNNFANVGRQSLNFPEGCKSNSQRAMSSFVPTLNFFSISSKNFWTP